MLFLIVLQDTHGSMGLRRRLFRLVMVSVLCCSRSRLGCSQSFRSLMAVGTTG